MREIERRKKRLFVKEILGRIIHFFLNSLCCRIQRGVACACFYDFSIVRVQYVVLTGSRSY